MFRPVISVVTATYNCASTVAECLASVATQTYRHREHVVVDGASTDGTMAILTAHALQLAVLNSEPDSGIYDALNKGIALARGDVVGFLHADDLYASPNVLAEIAKRTDTQAAVRKACRRESEEEVWVFMVVTFRALIVA